MCSKKGYNRLWEYITFCPIWEPRLGPINPNFYPWDPVLTLIKGSKPYQIMSNQAKTKNPEKPWFSGVCKHFLSLWERLMLRKCRIFSIFKSSCCLPVVYGRKLRSTVHNWWQLYICFFQYLSSLQTEIVVLIYIAILFTIDWNRHIFFSKHFS